MTIPDEHDIEAIYKSINYELGQVMFDKKLQITVSKNIEKTIGLFAAKVEGEKLTLEITHSQKHSPSKNSPQKTHPQKTLPKNSFKKIIQKTRPKTHLKQLPNLT